MRVLHVFPDTSRAGWTLGVIEGLCGGQIESGHAVEVVATNAGHNGPQAVSIDNPVAVGKAHVSYFPVHPLVTKLGIRIFDTFTISPRLNAWLRWNVGRFDLVHIYSVYALTSIVAGRACQEQGVPYVVSPVGNLDRYVGLRSRRLKEFHFAVAGRRLLNGAAAVHLMSRGEHNMAAEYAILAPQTVIGFGLDLSRYDLPSAPDSGNTCTPPAPLTIMFLGRIAQSKGLDLLVKAFERLIQGRDDCALLFVGPDQDGYRSVLSASQSPRAAARTVFTGFVPEQEKINAIARSDVFVMPSYTEAFGIALLEAMAAGLPAILTDRAALASEISAAKAALVVESSAEALAASVEWLLADSSRRSNLGAVGQTFVRSNFGWDNIVPAFLGMYRNCIDSSKRSASQERSS